MIVTPNMGLSAWDLGSDPYSYSQLSNNFSAIDRHDHSSGKGLQIPAGGIADGAVTTQKVVNKAITGVKIADGAISAIHIQDNSIENRHMTDGSIGTSELQNESVGFAKLAPSARIPLGLVSPWYRANSTVPIPVGWTVCDGVSWSSTPNDMGLTSGFKPDLRNRFVLGSAEGASAQNPSSPPPELSTGGSHVRDLRHEHTVPPHNHTVPNHSHPISTFVDQHYHRFYNTGSATGNPADLRELHQRTTAVPTSSGMRQAAYIWDLNAGSSGDPAIPMGPPENAPGQMGVAHNHGGNTGGSSNFSTVDPAALTTQGEGLPGASRDFRPQFIGLLYIMKVRN